MHCKEMNGRLLSDHVLNGDNVSSSAMDSLFNCSNACTPSTCTVHGLMVRWMMKGLEYSLIGFCRTEAGDT